MSTEFHGSQAPARSLTVSSVAELSRYGGHLFQAHAEECEPDRAAQLDLDWETFAAIEAAGQLIALAAWADDKLVGYAVATWRESERYRDHAVCVTDALYVDPHWRRRGIGVRLIEFLGRQAREKVGGKFQLLLHAKIHSQLEDILPRLGFEPEETVFTKDF